MSELDNLEILFGLTAILFQGVLVVHFALRKWRFNFALRHGWFVYALSIPAAAVSLHLLLKGKPQSLWLGGFLYLVWAIFGYMVEYVRSIEWRKARRWPIFIPYVVLYVATIMFYWWPLGLLARPLWYLCAVMFVVSTMLNISSHKGNSEQVEAMEVHP